MGISAVEASRGSVAGGNSGSVLTDAASFPACVARFKLAEGTGGSGTVLADFIGNVTTLQLTANGTGNAWVNAGAFTTAVSVGNAVYARTTGAAPAAVRNLGSGSLIILAHLKINTTAAMTTYIPGVGTPTSGTYYGYALSYDGSLNRLSLLVAGTGGTSLTASFPELSVTDGATYSIGLVWDRSASSTGLVSLYANGTLVATRALSGDPLLVNVANDASSGRINFGYNGISAIPEALFYDVSIWHPESIPSDIALTMARWSAMPYEFPQGLSGLAHA